MSSMKPQRGKTPRKGPAPKRPTQTDPVQVYSRIRPLSNPDTEKCVLVVSQTTVELTPPEGSHALRHGTAFAKQTQYTFSRVFDEYSDQKSIFEHCACPLVEDVIKGKNTLLFAYGITSSGKTYTMTGSPQEQGILPRCLDVLFNSLGSLQSKKYVFRPDKMNGFEVQTEADAMLERQRRDVLPRFTAGTKTPGRTDSDSEDPFTDSPRVRDPTAVKDVEDDNNYAVFVSYVQIYNNYIYDLLEELQYDPILGYKQPQSKVLREDCAHNMYVSGVHEVEVKSTEEAYTVFLKGQKRRKVAQTALNAESSRSHSVFNIRLVQAPLDPLGQEVIQDPEKLIVSQLSLVDLAGSERTGRTGGTGDRLKEAGNINQSLMVLRTCMEALRENQKTGANKMVPYRDSKLTHLFKNYFDGEGKVRMIVCVNPLAEEYDETVRVMQFAEMTQEVQVARPQQVTFDTGLQRGRRRMAQSYRQAVERAVETGSDSDVPEPLLYSLGPLFPSLEMKDPRDEQVFKILAEYLAERQRKRLALCEDFDRREERFRKHLLDMEQENRDLKTRLAEAESKLKGINDEESRLKRRVRSLEQHKDNLQRAASNYELDRKELERELDEKTWQIAQIAQEKYHMKDEYKTQLALTEHTYKQRMDNQKRKIEEASQAQLRHKQKKLEMVRNILESDTDNASAKSTEPNQSMRPTRSGGQLSSRYAGVPSSGYGTSAVNSSMARSFPAKSEPDLSMKGKPGSVANTASRFGDVASHARAKTSYTGAYTPSSTSASTRYNATSGTGSKPMSTPARRGRSPPPTKPKPVLAKYHRRSRSQGDIWLDHKPSPVVETDTIMQPRMTKRRSVKSLEKKDLARTNKYVLTQQQEDSDGGISSQLFKGNVMRTSAGGTAVVFTDVETLKQKSPGDRKRRSPPLMPEDFSGEWTDTDERCRIAIEGHGDMKRIKSSAV